MVVLSEFNYLPVRGSANCSRTTYGAPQSFTPTNMLSHHFTSTQATSTLPRSQRHGDKLGSIADRTLYIYIHWQHPRQTHTKWLWSKGEIKTATESCTGTCLFGNPNEKGVKLQFWHKHSFGPQAFSFPAVPRTANLYSSTILSKSDYQFALHNHL